MHRKHLVGILILIAGLTTAGPASAQSCSDIIEYYNVGVRQTNAKCENGTWRRNPGLCLKLYDAQLARWGVVEQNGCGERSMYHVIRDRIGENKSEILYATNRQYRAREDAAGEYLDRQAGYNRCMARVYGLCGGQGPQCVTANMYQCSNR